MGDRWLYKWEVEKWDDVCGQLFQDVGPIEEEKKLKTEERDERTDKDRFFRKQER